MAGFLEIMLIAAGAQLAVLPGEKVQFIIAGLSTRYNPYVVVAAAGSAFAGWTALEILFGSAVQNALPAVYLDGITIVLFLLFGVMLYRSAPADGNVPTTTDGGFTELADGGELSVFGVDLPKPVATFVGIFSMMAVGEFGDKTQLITISLAIQYGASPAIWVGEMIAIVPVSLANALFFHRFAHKFNLRKAHFAGAIIFVFFALDTLLAVTTGFSVWGTVVEGVAALLLAAV
ncbi:TMEM165/GDT1 family protein [Salinibaculum rarum]|uniref:TMEM165/GDT1 family protein n=1 Tax=Salinibaculum rarum TaxID=3058903 RepID=UPI00265DF348|nr:TMEM165/GDT1 family protein [Salinibaculum sp. KK48]